MQCPKCGKESNNLRSCPFCHAEYPAPQTRRPTPHAGFQVAADHRATPVGSMPGVPGAPQAPPGVVGGVKYAFARQSIAVKAAVAVLLLASAGWYFLAGRERSIPVGVVIPNVIDVPMQPSEAAEIIRQASTTARVEMRGDAVMVTFPTETFPQRRDGQMALVQRYARADEIVNGVKRTINFYDPKNELFAKADGAGVVMTR